MRSHQTKDANPPTEQDRRQMLVRMIRVNHAGEYGARRIYEGQMAVLRHHRVTPVLQRMHQQEMHHLDTFEKLMVARRVRPTALFPLWHFAGYALGTVTALMGERTAMACTVAVETVIDEHYAQQTAHLGEDEASLRATVEAFRADEIEHREIGLAYQAEKAPAYPLLSATIKLGARAAIWLAERI